MKLLQIIMFLFCLVQRVKLLIPPKFQWKIIDFAWDGDFKNIAVTSGGYIPENIMPTGIARWKDKLFITIPRWKKGVPSSLNFVYLNGSQSEPLRPYPSWKDAFILDDAEAINSNSTVVSAFRMHVDKCDRLWVVDNGVADMSKDVKQISEPAVVVFDLNQDAVVRRYHMTGEVLRDSSVLTSVVVDFVGKSCDCGAAYAYITDMGSNALIVYSFKDDEAWRVENHYFHFDPHAGVYKVGDIDFYGSDGVSSAALSQVKKDGYRDLYLHPTSSTKQFKMSTKLLRHKDAPKEEIFNGVLVVGDKGPYSQASACDFDAKNNVLFFTQVCKNAIGCWNVDKPFTAANTPTVVRDCNLLEYPNDVKVDKDGNLWILSNRQARFLHGQLDPNQVNFRVLSAPAAALVQGTTCEKPSLVTRAWSALGSRKNSAKMK